MDSEFKFGQRFYPMYSAGYAGAELEYDFTRQRDGHEGNRQLYTAISKAINDA